MSKWRVKTKINYKVDKYGAPESTILVALMHGDSVIVESHGKLAQASLTELAERYNRHGVVPPLEDGPCMAELSPEMRKKLLLKDTETPDLPWHGKPVKRDADGNVIRGEDGESV